MVYVLTSPIGDFTVKVRPGTDGLTVNGIPVRLDMVVRADDRIDLAVSGNRVFIVEHVVACLTMYGIDSAEIIGVTEQFDEARRTHHEAVQLNLPVSASVGPPDGRICRDLCYQVEDSRCFVDRPFRLESITKGVRVEGLGVLEVEPCDCEGLEVVVLGEWGETRAYFDPLRGLDDPPLRRRICSAVTPALIGFDSEEALLHAAGDLIGDLAGLGHIGGARATLWLADKYHDLSVRALRYLKR